MKSVAKYLSVAAAVALSSAAFANQDDAIITFSTTYDRYADGTPVAEGEFYALCWSADNEFDGITAQGEAVNPNEKVLAKIPLATKEHHCPTTVLEVSSDYVKGGYFFVYLLDTRDTLDADGKPAASSAALETSGVNGSTVVVSAAASGNGTIISQTGVATTTDYDETDVTDVPNPTIESLDFDDDNNAIIAVGNMVPYVKYNVKKGATVDKITTLGDNPIQGDAKGVTFVISKEDANFFQVVRQPLANK